MRDLLSKATFGLALTVALPAYADSVIPQISDGQPWTMTASNGREAQLVLNPDGTGQMRFGLMRRAISWRDNDGALCMSGMPNGDQCLSLTARGDSFVGEGADGRTMVLRR